MDLKNDDAVQLHSADLTNETPPEKTNAPNLRASPTLFGLPLELRDIIWGHVQDVHISALSVKVPFGPSQPLLLIYGSRRDAESPRGGGYRILPPVYCHCRGGIRRTRLKDFCEQLDARHPLLGRVNKASLDYRQRLTSQRLNGRTAWAPDELLKRLIRLVMTISMCIRSAEAPGTRLSGFRFEAHQENVAGGAWFILLKAMDTCLERNECRGPPETNFIVGNSKLMKTSASRGSDGLLGRWFDRLFAKVEDKRNRNLPPTDYTYVPPQVYRNRAEALYWSTVAQQVKLSDLHDQVPNAVLVIYPSRINTSGQ